MFLELIATIVAGFAAAGLVLIANKLLGGRLPKWFMPVAAAAAMLAATIANEYGWFPRTMATLPDGFEIVETVENKAMYRPWTYVYPYVERFAAVDTETVKTHPAQPGKRLADVFYFGRWAPVHQLPVLADCPGFKRAALTDGVAFGADGHIDGVDWIPVTGTDPILTAICGAG
jgi:hypothetical protein